MLPMHPTKVSEIRAKSGAAVEVARPDVSILMALNLVVRDVQKTGIKGPSSRFRSFSASRHGKTSPLF